jgi:hypothetical protein
MIPTTSWTRATVLSLLLLLSLEAGCMRLGFERDEVRQPPVEAGVPDAPRIEHDGPIDAVSDGSSMDTVQDAAVMRKDKGAPPPDAPVPIKDKGAPLPDSPVYTKDKGVPLPDAPVPPPPDALVAVLDLNLKFKDKSLGLDLQAATQACAASATQAALYPAGTMAVCTLKTGTATLNQCQAETLCNTNWGWHLCTASEYKARGGTASQWPSVQAWIKGCIRTKDKLFAPTDQICEPTCGVMTGKQMPTAWDCTNGIASFNYANENLGLSKASICWRVGIDDPSTGACWSPLAASVPLDSALCCSP